MHNMKDYGRNGRLIPKKKKKRKFEAIVNTVTKGIYSSFTLKKDAKKVTGSLVGKRKHIIFHLRKKENQGKYMGRYKFTSEFILTLYWNYSEWNSIIKNS